MLGILGFVGPIAAGAGCWYAAGKCRGRNARHAFRFFSWGFFLLLLRYLSGEILFFPVGLLLSLLPSAICFWLGANSILKEMRAQQKGEYTDVA